MTAKRTSTIDSVWATRPGGGGRTERQYRDFLIDGVSLSSVIRRDVISPFGWGVQEQQSLAADRLLGRAVPDLPGNRVSLYVCPECGDLGCGAVTLRVIRDEDTVTWMDFGFENNYEDEIHTEGFEEVGPFRFSMNDYEKLFDRLRDT